MLQNDTTAQILDVWQTSLEVRLEAGQRPEIDLAVNQRPLDGLTGLMALEAFAARRQDVTQPAVVAGGGSPLWLAALFHAAYPRTEPQPPALTTLFAGTDRTTYAATRATIGPDVHTRAGDLVLKQSLALPSALLADFAPAADRGATRAWATFPFIVGNPHPDSVPQLGPSWTAYAAMVLALFLVLLALVI